MAKSFTYINTPISKSLLIGVCVFMIHSCAKKQPANKENGILYFEIDQSSVPTWILNEEEVAFSALIDENKYQLFSVSLDKNIRPIETNGYSARYPTYSNKKGKMLFISNHSGFDEIYSIKLNGGDLTQITNDGFRKEYQSISPSGRYNLFIRHPDSLNSRSELCLIDLVSKNIEVLNADPQGYLGWPAWSSKEDKVYSYKLNGPDRNNIIEINKENKEVKFLFEDSLADAWCPQISPNDSTLYYLSNPSINGQWGNNSHIRKRKIDGSIDEIIYDGPRFESSISLSESGNKIAFLSNTYGYYQLFVTLKDGSTPIQLTFQSDMELTKIIREKGIDFGVNHYEKNNRLGKLFTERAMDFLIEDYIKDQSVIKGKNTLLKLSKIIAKEEQSSFKAHELAVKHYQNVHMKDSVEYHCLELLKTNHNSIYAIDLIGFTSSMQLFNDLKKDNLLSEQQLNSLGYSYLNSDRTGLAIKIFKLNTEAFPKSANVYDSYAEALYMTRNFELAISNYEKSLELDPNNDNALNMIKKIEIELNK
ncbi:MAG TPA: hypothetical protein VKN14_11035 [Flavobacteriaceae bacterium]|nr:hypothetical protein [Flavobacteriaceae bacterium]